jgi:hypothetical protein
MRITDKRRLDWIEAGGQIRCDWITRLIVPGLPRSPGWWTTGREPNYKRPRYFTAREAIDAAMREEAEQQPAHSRERPGSTTRGGTTLDAVDRVLRGMLEGTSMTRAEEEK